MILEIDCGRIFPDIVSMQLLDECSEKVKRKALDEAWLYMRTMN